MHPMHRSMHDASKHASSMHDASGTDASKHASPNGREGKKADKESRWKVPGTPIPEDWEPSPENVAKAVRLELDPVRVAAKFRAYFRSKAGVDGLSSDWQQRYAYWLDGEHPPGRAPAAAERAGVKDRREAVFLDRARSLGFGPGAAGGGNGRVIDEVAERTDAPQGVGRTRAPP